MTSPSPQQLEREQDKLYLTDAELIRRLGVPEKVARVTIAGLDKNPRQSGFPQKSKLFGGRRYWPAVKSWLDRHHGLKISDPNDL